MEPIYIFSIIFSIIWIQLNMNIIKNGPSDYRDNS